MGNKNQPSQKELEAAREAEFKAKLLGMNMEAIIELHPELSAELDKIVESRISESSEDGQEIADELHERIEEQAKEIEALKGEMASKDATIASLRAEGKVEAKSGVIFDVKKLDPKKRYVSGPNGKGFVESK